MYQTILITTDLTEASHNTLRKAVVIASQFTRNIYLLHVIEPPASTVYAASLGFAEYTHPVADDAIVVMAALGDELNIPADKQFVKIGQIKTHIHELATQIGADLIIVGSHSQHVLANLLGATANAVVQSADCDVLTVRQRP